MSKENTTVASKAFPPEKVYGDEPSQARSYPGRPLPATSKVVEASQDAAALREGKSNSMGLSADGSVKGEASSAQPVRSDE
jgi:hypothetical protein